MILGSLLVVRWRLRCYHRSTPVDATTVNAAPGVQEEAFVFQAPGHWMEFLSDRHPPVASSHRPGHGAPIGSRYEVLKPYEPVAFRFIPYLAHDFPERQDGATKDSQNIVSRKVTQCNTSFHTIAMGWSKHVCVWDLPVWVGVQMKHPKYRSHVSVLTKSSKKVGPHKHHIGVFRGINYKQGLGVLLSRPMNAAHDEQLPKKNPHTWHWNHWRQSMSRGIPWCHAVSISPLKSWNKTPGQPLWAAPTTIKHCERLSTAIQNFIHRQKSEIRTGYFWLWCFYS